MNNLPPWGRACLCFALTIAAGLIVGLAFGPVFEDAGFWILGIVSMLMYLGYFLVFVMFRKTVERQDYLFRMKPTNAVISGALGLVCIAGFMLVQFAAIDLFALMGYDTGRDTPVTSINNFGRYVMAVFTMAVLPAVVEELIFRGVIFKEFKKHNVILAILASSLMFAAFHLTLVQFVYQFILGVVLAFVYMRTGNLIHAIILHFVNNFFIITYTFIAGSDQMLYCWDAMTIVTAILLAVVGTATIISLVVGLKKEAHATAPADE